MDGHTESVLCASFSPCSTMLATGSGDTTVCLWDLDTCTRAVSLPFYRRTLKMEFSEEWNFLFFYPIFFHPTLFRRLFFVQNQFFKKSLVLGDPPRSCFLGFGCFVVTVLKKTAFRWNGQICSSVENRWNLRSIKR